VQKSTCFYLCLGSARVKLHFCSIFLYNCIISYCAELWFCNPLCSVFKLCCIIVGN